MDAGHDEPCLFRFDAIDAGKTSAVAFMLLENGPMPTGEYPIARPMPNETVGQDDHARKYEGQMVASFTLGEDRPLIGEYCMEYMGQGGALRIGAVSRRWIAGNIRIAGPRNLEIEVDLSVPKASIASRGNVDACIKPPD